jgi:DNA-binding transcriptional regulator YiaG
MEETGIKQICETYSITQTGLSKRFNIPLRTVQDWYAGRRTPPDYVVGMITSLLEIDMRTE